MNPTLTTSIVKGKDGRSTLFQAQPDGSVVLSFRSPIQREHVRNGCLIKQDLITRDGTKRVATILLDEASAEAAYQLLARWKKEKTQTERMLKLVYFFIPHFHRSILRNMLFIRK